MVKRIENYQFSKKFKKEYQSLPKKIQDNFDKKLSLFLENMFHPSIRTKRVQGTKYRWEGSITMKYRFTFDFYNNTVLSRTVGTHDILSK